MKTTCTKLILGASTLLVMITTGFSVQGERMAVGKKTLIEVTMKINVEAFSGIVVCPRKM